MTFAECQHSILIYAASFKRIFISRIMDSRNIGTVGQDGRRVVLGGGGRVVVERGSCERPRGGRGGRGGGNKPPQEDKKEKKPRDLPITSSHYQNDRKRPIETDPVVVRCVRKDLENGIGREVAASEQQEARKVSAVAFATMDVPDDDPAEAPAPEEPVAKKQYVFYSRGDAYRQRIDAEAYLERAALDDKRFVNMQAKGIWVGQPNSSTRYAKQIAEKKALIESVKEYQKCLRNERAAAVAASLAQDGGAEPAPEEQGAGPSAALM